MVTQPVAVLRRLLSESIGDYRLLSASSNGDACGTTIVDTELANLTEDDDGIQGWIIMASGTSIGEIRRIKASGGYAASTTTLTTNFAFGAQIASTETFELHLYDPADMLIALNRAIQQLFPSRGRRGLWLPIRDETIMVDQLLTNGGFESTIVAGAHPSWTNAGSPTVTAETTAVYQGSQASKIVSGGSAGSHYQSPTINVSLLAGKTMTFAARAWASAASIARVRLDFQTGDSSDIVDGDYHTGDASWRRIYAQGAVPTNATEVRAICEVVANGTAYFDNAHLAGLPVFKYTIPTTILRGPHRITQQYDGDDIDGPYHKIGDNDSPTTERVLRLEGMGSLTLLTTTETSTTEATDEQAELIVAKAAAILFGMEQTRADGDEALKYESLRLKWEAETDRLLQTVGRPPMGAQMPNGVWHLEEDSSGRYVTFNRPRGSMN